MAPAAPDSQRSKIRQIPAIHRCFRRKSLASAAWAKAPTGPRQARPNDKLRAVPGKAFREALMSRCRRLKQA